MCPNTIPSRTIKWLFSQLKIRFASVHHSNTLVKFLRHSSKDGPNTEKSSIKTSKNFSTMSEKMAIIHR